MSRIRAKALALVNWRGVFYERYLLDSHVTALEGANGAGKTTVLIGCYVVLLPDMSRLRFTNLGEHSPSGGDRGLWGRLGESNRPSYAVLELSLEHEQRFLAGVHLQRKTEPTLDLTPFIITSLDDSIQLQDLLLERGEMDSVPELSLLRDQVAAKGAVMQVFSTAKDYFASLFEQGITPLRLSSDSDRNKFNEMLRTSMTGGISRALTSELRDFLLKEEGSLADTLKRMRANLDACRRTRTEIEESRRLEHEIAGIYEAGHQMMAAAIHATRERAEELHRRFEEASHKTKEEEEATQHFKKELIRKRSEYEYCKKELNENKLQLKNAHQHLDHLKQARIIAQRIEKRKAELGQLELNHYKATLTKEQSEAKRERARKEYDEVQHNYETATSSLADYQKGLDELHRRASEHSLTTRKMERARQLLASVRIEIETIEQVLSDVNHHYEDLSKEYLQLSTQLKNAEQHRKDFNHVHQSLLAIENIDIKPTEVFQHAQAVSRKLRSLNDKAGQRKALSQEILETQKHVERQVHVRKMAYELSTEERKLDSAKAVQDTFNQTEADIELLDSLLRQEFDKAETARRKCSDLKNQKAKLDQAVGTWLEILSRVEPLEQKNEQTLRTGDELQALRANLNMARDNIRDQLVHLRDKHVQLKDEAARLEQSGGLFPTSLLRACDAVEGELLAMQFEELAIDKAGEIEALLGPLAHAVVVDDPVAASKALCDFNDTPESMWLIGGETSHEIDMNGQHKDAVNGNNVIINDTTSWRVTRIPKHPTLGRRARANRIQELREEAEVSKLQNEQYETDLREISSQLNVTNQLLSEVHILECGDPSSDYERVTSLLKSTSLIEQEHRNTANKMSFELTSLKEYKTTLQALLPKAYLLDEPDLEQKLNVLNHKLSEANAAHQRLLDVADHKDVLESKMDILRTPPLSPTDITAMQQRVGVLKHEQETYFEAAENLRFVDEHRIALTWTDAADAIKQASSLEPAIQNQLEQARTALDTVKTVVANAEEELELSKKHFHEIDAEVQSIMKSIKRDEEDWQSYNLDSATDEDIRFADEVVTNKEKIDQELNLSTQAFREEIARLDERSKSATEKVLLRRKEQEKAKEGWLPNQERWEKLEALAIEHKVLDLVMTRQHLERYVGKGSGNIWGDAKGEAASLKERLSHARDSNNILNEVNGFIGAQELSGEPCLHAWLVVRDWLRQRIPTQIAEVAEPILALERLRIHLTGLEERLDRQEADLRGESSDVAKNIDIHIRRSQHRVSKLNHDLSDVRFGSIHGVRLKLERIERMEQILLALRDRETQKLLFQSEIPIDEALDELFRRYGGSGRTTGQNLLDYREYIEPKVEIRRQSSDHWEVANATRMSTGEAIGVGAALMMVVLTAWERDANLLRPKRSLGTLRLLFLDEANRLSQDNLSVLFDLCQNLDLQLIIAAPEVAQAEGNTTYHMVRCVDDAGHEEVVVSGRRLARENQS